jgi:hypothetical protein
MHAGTPLPAGGEKSDAERCEGIRVRGSERAASAPA